MTLTDRGGAVLTLMLCMIQKKELGLQIKTDEDGNFKAEKYKIEIEVNILNTLISFKVVLWLAAVTYVM